MNIDGVLLFLFLALTLPTAAAWFVFRRELMPHHLVLGLWGLGVVGMVALCAGVPFDSVHIGNEVGRILERFMNVFGFIGVFFALALGIGVGEAGTSAWEHYAKRA